MPILPLFEMTDETEMSMKRTTKVMAIGIAASLTSMMMWADPIEKFEIEFAYDARESTAQTYQRAQRMARKACQIGSRQMAVKRAQSRICVAPLVEQIVVKSGDELLLAMHAEETGRAPQHFLLVEK